MAGEKEDWLNKLLKTDKQQEKTADGVKKQQSMLKEALGDLDAELSGLKSKKDAMERNLGRIETSLGSAKKKEVMLRDEISKLISDEEELGERKNQVEKKLDKLKEKLAKISRIEEELKEVE